MLCSGFAARRAPGSIPFCGFAAPCTRRAMHPLLAAILPSNTRHHFVTPHLFLFCGFAAIYTQVLRACIAFLSSNTCCSYINAAPHLFLFCGFAAIYVHSGAICACIALLPSNTCSNICFFFAAFAAIYTQVLRACIAVLSSNTCCSYLYICCSAPVSFLRLLPLYTLRCYAPAKLCCHQTLVIAMLLHSAFFFCAALKLS